MSANTQPRSPEPSVERDQVHLSLPSSTPSEFETSERKPASGIALLSHGSSARRWQEGDVDRVDGYGRGNCDEYVREDIKNRVFVDFEVFMKSVLHVPQDWRIRWSQAIEVIRTDPEFKEYHEEYLKRCGNLTTQERSLYEPLMEAVNAVLAVLSRSGFDGISCGIPQYYRVNDPKNLRGRVFNGTSPSPDPVVPPKDCDPSKTENTPIFVVDGKRATSLSMSCGDS